MANNTLLASDNFQRANENPLSNGGTWTTLPSKSALQLASNLCEAAVVSVACEAYVNNVSWPNDQISEVTIKTLTQATDTVVLLLRASTVDQSKYQLNISKNPAGCNIYRVSSTGTATVIKALPNYTTFASGDVWSFAVSGTLLIASLNGIPQGWISDSNFTSGVPAVGLVAASAVTSPQISSWRGYSTAQQDGIWAKKGCVLTPIASDLGNSTSNGTQNPSIIFEGNAQLLSGNVYKMWFTGGQNLAYAESTDGLNWTRRGTNLLTGEGTCPVVIKNGSTYHLYCQPGNETTFTVQHYTSSDGITWAGGSTVFTTGTAGQWDDGELYYFSPFLIDTAGTYGPAGTWYAYYTGSRTQPSPQKTGLATSTDGSTWTRYAGNPIASNFWGVVRPFLVGNTWYMWGQTINPGQATGADNQITTGEGLRMQTTDLKTFTNPVKSAHHTQIFEGVNITTGGFYPSFVMDVNGTAMMYGVATMDDTGTTPYYYEIVAAVGPAPTSQVAVKPENALSQLVTDSFQRGNENPLSDGGSWASIPTQSNLQLVSNFAEGSSTASCAMAFTKGSVGNDQYSSMTIQTLASGSQIFPIVRASTGSATFYYAAIQGALGVRQTNGSISRLLNGVNTVLLNNLAYTPQVGDVFTLSVIGNVITLYQNGFVIGQIADQSPIASGFPGMGISPTTSVSNAQVSAWAGGNANVIPQYQTLVQAFGNPVTLPVNFGNKVTTPVNFGNPAPPSTFGNPVTSTPMNFGNVMTQINGIWYCVPRTGTQN